MTFHFNIRNPCRNNVSKIRVFQWIIIKTETWRFRFLTRFMFLWLLRWTVMFRPNVSRLTMSPKGKTLTPNPLIQDALSSSNILNQPKTKLSISSSNTPQVCSLYMISKKLSEPTYETYTHPNLTQKSTLSIGSLSTPCFWDKTFV